VCARTSAQTKLEDDFQPLRFHRKTDGESRKVVKYSLHACYQNRFPAVLSFPADLFKSCSAATLSTIGGWGHPQRLFEDTSKVALVAKSSLGCHLSQRQRG
jgi:hypothetical protein